ncbi:hypothetical protein BaRGS_00021036 [Batillaria attramentaria]|uniref:G-protein coupled receptors family 1 profile domain-containing protein n=1 Tax=Batillaria attramentaria TaxID=370345 RepID=A0ABD0KKT7_9CAEN
MTASQTNSTSPPSPQEKEDEEEDLSMFAAPVGQSACLFYLVYTVMYWTWAFGRPVCKTFLVVDFTACTMSTLAVVLVAWDRLILVKEGASYSLLETKRKAYGRLAVCWIFSFLLFSPAIVFWDIVRGYSILPAEECDVEFWTNFEYTAVTEITAFSVPMLSLLFINSRVYLALRKSRRQFARATDTLTDLGKASSPLQPTSANDGRLTVSIATSSAARSAYEHAFTHATSIKRQSRERRARIILTLLVIALVICWLPYSVATIILGWCSNCVDTNLYEFFHWLLYTKSSFNPFLYAYNSPRFRKNIIELLSPLLPAKCLGKRGMKGH